MELLFLEADCFAFQGEKFFDSLGLAGCVGTRKTQEVTKLQCMLYSQHQFKILKIHEWVHNID